MGLHSPLLIMMMGSFCFGFSCFMSVFASLKFLVLGHRTVVFGPIALLQSTVYSFTPSVLNDSTLWDLHFMRDRHYNFKTY